MHLKESCTNAPSTLNISTEIEDAGTIPTKPQPTLNHHDCDTTMQLGVCSLIEDHSEFLSSNSKNVHKLHDQENNPVYYSDGSSYTHSTHTDSNVDSKSDIDDSIAEESIDEIRSQNRICSTIEDYDNDELVFSEANLTLWK